MKTVEIRNITLGEGIPKICVSLTGETEQTIMEEVKVLKDLSVDMVEWRVDCFDEVFLQERVCEVLLLLRQELKHMPILFTFRTVAEGGNKEISLKQYEELIRVVACTKIPDLIDIEALSKEKGRKALIADVRREGAVVVGSYHDFEKTPAKIEIINRFKKIQQSGADIAKIAVMPTCKKDVLTLMEAGLEMKELYANVPVVAIAMGEDGKLSRIAGEFFGSAITFAAAEKVSAPGQIGVEALKSAMEAIHRK